MSDASNTHMRHELLHLLAQLALHCPVAEEASAWAVAALIADHDTDAVRVLAGLSADSRREEIAPWLRRAAQELGVRMPTPEESGWLVTLLVEREARELAVGMADGRIGLVEGSVRLAHLAVEIAPGDAELRRLFNPFVAVSSETDHLPLAADRVNWNADALRAKDEEIRAYEEHVRPKVEPACRALAAALDRDAARVTAFFAQRP